MCEGIDPVMKSFRILGAVFCVFGFFFALLGILASVLPSIENEQMRMILHSFQETSTDTLTNTLNGIVRFCLRSSYFLLFSGISLMVAGGLINSAAHKMQSDAAGGADAQPLVPLMAEATGIPVPAYCPGGLAPPVVSLESGGIAETIPLDDEPLDFANHSARKAPPISGGVEPSFSSDESDAQRLMRHDRQLTAGKPPGRQSVPDYTQYLSNSESAETPRDGNPPVKIVDRTSSAASRKPRIVSTMGKRKL
jgi:hypothetical protein